MSETCAKCGRIRPDCIADPACSTGGYHRWILNVTACAVRERTADGVQVGRCWFQVENGRCPRHGDVTKVQKEYARTGYLTDEGDLYEARGQKPPWWGRSR